METNDTFEEQESSGSKPIQESSASNPDDSRVVRSFRFGSEGLPPVKMVLLHLPKLCCLRDGGFAVLADSDEHGVGEGANFAFYKLVGDLPH